MPAWWTEATGLVQFFYCGTLFFTLFLIWQLVALFIGLGGEDLDADAAGAGDAGGISGGDTDTTYAEFEHGAEADAVESVASFKLLTLRSVVAFFTLFFWSGSFDLTAGTGLGRVVAVGSLWGLAGMVGVAAIFYLMQKMQDSGNRNLATAVGQTGTVYADIPDEGVGEVRITVSGRISYVKARTADRKACKMGTPVKAVRTLGQTMLEVTPE